MAISPQERVFDYIIVGAGSAGCVLANRLSENGKHSVCLIEAGPEISTPLEKIPSGFAYFMFSKLYNWGYNAKPESSIRSGAPLFVPRGKAVGGCSATNGMVYIRGQKEDYDDWEKAGNPGWSYQDLLPYFKKSENNLRGANEYHGTDGPLHIDDTPLFYPISKVFLNAATQAGYKQNADFNGAKQEGVGVWQRTIKDGVRYSAARAFLDPVRSRKNLSILSKALVEKILVENGAANGVQVMHAGEQIQLTANREVILSAGTIASPQLLMLSGIGDQEELKAVGVECIHHLPGVGKNLQEHVDACVLVRSKKSDGLTLSITGLLKMIPAAIQYLLTRRGKLTSIIIETGGFIKSQSHLERPDLQLGMLPLLFDDNGRDLRLMRKKGYSCHICILRPKSSGRVSLQSSSPTDPPEIDFNFFSHPDDKKTIVDGIKRVREILSAEAFDEYRAEEIHPGAGIVDDDAIFAKSKERLGTVFHPVGTCKMGSDDLAVVSRRLNVHGIKNLRVIDASIMPKLVSGNTNAPTMAIAEYASEMVLADAT
ncbi:MAG: GMC family oxidoreductase N-terminal domain-containing protein [Halioglobus sp.]